jgi:hypothetical protein
MRRAMRAGVIAGTAGPLVFAGVVVTLTLLERDFMATLGWDPLAAPTRDWPSGLALGPLGLVMTVTFIACGFLLAVFAFGMHQAYRSTRGGPAASRLLALAGLAMGLLAFPTDPTYRHLPLTWHGLLHDAAFGVLGAALCLSLVAFGLVFRSTTRGRAIVIFSWATAALVVPSFAVKGIVFYVFLAAFLAWCVTAAFALQRRAKDETPPPELQ